MEVNASWHKSSECCSYYAPVLQTVAMVMPNKSQNTNRKLPHTKNRNTTEIWNVDVSEPVCLATKMLIKLTRCMRSALCKQYLTNNLASLYISMGCDTRSLHNPHLGMFFNLCNCHNAAIFKLSKNYLVDLCHGCCWRRLSGALRLLRNVSKGQVHTLETATHV